MKYLIMCKSLTNAQRAALLLERRGIGAAVVKAPQSLRAGGCGYAGAVRRSRSGACRLHHERHPRPEYRDPFIGKSRGAGADLRL